MGQDSCSCNFHWLKGMTHKLCFQVLQFSALQLSLLLFICPLFHCLSLETKQMGNMLSCTVSFFGALPSGHQEQGSRVTVLVCLCTLQSTDLSREVITSMQHCKLEDVICGMRLSAETDGQTREVYCVMFFFY